MIPQDALRPRRWMPEEMEQESAEGFDAFGPEFTKTSDMLLQAAGTLRALTLIAIRLECREGGSGHYCPNCDNSLYDVLQQVCALLPPTRPRP